MFFYFIVKLNIKIFLFIKLLAIIGDNVHLEHITMAVAVDFV